MESVKPGLSVDVEILSDHDLAMVRAAHFGQVLGIGNLVAARSDTAVIEDQQAWLGPGRNLGELRGRCVITSPVFNPVRHRRRAVSSAYTS